MSAALPCLSFGTMLIHYLSKSTVCSVTGSLKCLFHLQGATEEGKGATGRHFQEDACLCQLHISMCFQYSSIRVRTGA